MDEIELPPECWMLIIQNIGDYRSMIYLSWVSKLLYSLIPNELWLIKANDQYYYLLGTNNKHGKYKKYHSNGKKESSNRFINGKLGGRNKKWYKNGNLICDLYYKEDKENGECRWWHENGVINYHYFCNLGPFKSWYKNSYPKVDCVYVNGILEDDYKSWYENGNPKLYCHFNQGKVIGDYKEWDENNNLIKEKVFTEPVTPWLELENKIKMSSFIFI